MGSDEPREPALPAFLDRSVPPRVREPIVRSQILAWVAALVLGIAWGAAWRRISPLSELGSPLPILLIVVGPILVVAWGGYHIVRGSFSQRVQGYTIAIAAVASIAASALTPGLPSSVDVTGSVTGTIDGGALDPAATCHWGPGRDRVTRITAHLGIDTRNLGGGDVVVDLASGGMRINDVPLAIGEGSTAQDPAAGERPADNRSGTVTLQPESAVVAGTLTWSCPAAPAG